MLALLVSLSFAIYCGYIGAAWIYFLRPKAPLLRSWLVSPAVGLSIIVLSVMILNQWGLPVSAFARLLGASLFLLASYVYVKRRVRFPIKALAPVIACLILSLALVSWPALTEGFNWVGYGNVDMLGYVFEAQRQLLGGFYDTPQLGALGGTDYTQYYWFYHVPGFVRFGSENTLAFLAGSLGIDPLNGFMPTIIALGLIQIAAAGGLAIHHGRNRRLGLYTVALLSFSPLLLLSVQLQVIAQVGGIALMLAICSLAAEKFQPRKWSLIALLKRALIMAPIFAGLLVFYPELLPFCAATLFLTHLISTQNIRQFFRIIGLATATVIVAIILLRHNFLIGLMTLLFHGGQGTTSAAAEISAHPFGIAILPSALPALLGLSNIYSPPQEPTLSILIVLAIIAIPIIGIVGLKRRFINHPTFILFLVMVMIGVALHLTPNPFGVFKLMMFIQPALTLALAATMLCFHRYLRWGIGIVIFYVYISVGQSYLKPISGITGYGSFLPLQSAASFNLSDLPPDPQFAADTPSMAFDHLLALQLRGAPLHFMNRDGISGAIPWSINNDPRNLWPMLHYLLPASIGQASQYLSELTQNTYHSLDIFDAHMVELGGPIPDDSIFVSVRDPFRHFNKLHNTNNSLMKHPVFQFRYRKDLQNHLVFLNTSRSNDYYSFLGSLDRSYSYYQNEPDPLQDFTGPFYAIGSYFIFEIENPDKIVRLRIAFSRTLLGKGNQSLPPYITVLGKTTNQIRLDGAGAVNVYSDPIEPLTVNGRHFIAVDLSSPPILLKHPKSPIMALFNSSTNLDWRHVTGFGRDISAVSETEYDRMITPSGLKHFPDDLLSNPELEFSGLYEDGWVSPHATVTLGSSGHRTRLKIEGNIPSLPFLKSDEQPELIIRFNDEEILRLPLVPGPISVNHEISESNGRNRIELESTVHCTLPSPDDRPVSFLISEMSLD